MRIGRSLSLITALIFPGFAFAAGAGITYHGRLLQPNGEPVTASSVQFRIQVRTPGSENCLMYQETQAIDMSASDGIFAVTINDGTATVVNTEPFTLDRVFQNRGTFSFAGGKCIVGNSYVPNVADGRKLSVEFNDGSGWEPLPAQSVNFVPMAMESMTVGGFAAGNFLRVVDGSGNPVSLSPWTSANYTALTDLVGGTSTAYRPAASSVPGADVSGNISGNAAGFTGSLAGDVTGTQGTTSVVKLRGRDIDTAVPSNGQVLAWNQTNSRWEPTTPSAGAGTVTAVTAAAPLASSGGATPNITITKADTSTNGYLSSTDWNTFNGKGSVASVSLTAPSIFSVSGSPITTTGTIAMSLASQNANQVFAGPTSGTAAPAFRSLSIADIRSTNTGAFLTGTTCSAGQALIYSAVSDTISCSSISLTSSQVTTALGAASTSANGYLTSTDWNTFNGKQNALGFTPVNKAGDTMSGALAVPTDGLTIGTNQLVATGGKIGIGTTTPGSPLDVSGAIRADMICDRTGANCKNISSGWTTGGSSTVGLLVPTTMPDMINCSGTYFHKDFFDSTNVSNNNRVRYAGYSTDYVYYHDSTGAKGSANGYGSSCPANISGVTAAYFWGGTPGSTWTQSGGNVSYSGGNVGVGTATPNALLDVNGTMRVSQICDSAGANCKTISGGWTSGAVTSVSGTGGLTGTVTSTGSLSLANIAANNLLANATGSAAAPVATTLSALIDSALTGSAQGNILYRGASGWAVLPPGTSGNFLKTQGTSADPVWAAGNSGTVTSVNMTVPSIMSVSGGPVTSSGTLAVSLASQGANTVFAGPTTGSAVPTFRALNISDVRSTVANGNFLTGGACTSGQALVYNSPADTISCATISLTSSQVTTALGAATTSTNGYLTSTDWNTFNGKQAALGFTPVNKAGDTMTGTLNLASNGLTVGTNQLTVSGGNVGIGTTNPVANLNIAAASPKLMLNTSTVNSGTNSIVFDFTGGAFAKAGIFSTAKGSNGGGNIQFAINTVADASVVTASDAKLSVTSIGNVSVANNLGVGVTAPADLLEVVGTSAPFMKIDTALNSGTSGIRFSHTGGGATTSQKAAILVPATGGYGRSSGIHFALNSAADSTNADVTDAKFSILEGGNVGIGTTTPTAKLEIKGTAGTDGIKFPDGTTQTTAYTGAGGGGGLVWNTITANATAAANNAYIVNSASAVTVTLPTTCAVGDRVKILGINSGGWTLAPGAGQSFVDIMTTSSTTARASINAGDELEVTCIVANTKWKLGSTTNALLDLNIAYPGSATTFSHTGGAQTYTVPANVTKLHVKMWGAGGAGGSSGAGGAGAYVYDDIWVTPGETLSVIVGSGGKVSGSTAAWGGGGLAAIKRGATTLVVAAGGGGAAYYYGGYGGCTSGGNGQGSNPGGGATQSAGGAAGAGGDAQVGSSFQGGNGMTGSSETSPAGYGGGGLGYWTSSVRQTAGGGAGYYGGGGSGERNNGYDSSAGGGSSYYSAAGTCTAGGSTGGAPNTGDSYYSSGIAAGGTSATSYAGGNAKIVIY